MLDRRAEAEGVPEPCQAPGLVAGVNPPPGIYPDGHSGAAVIQSASAKSAYGVMHWQWRDGWLVRYGDWKLIYNGVQA